MPWKNKLGTTYEIEIFPKESTVTELNFDYRISLAEIESENKFSSFNGYLRVLTVIRGQGITFNKEVLLPTEIKRFSGEEEVVSRPLVENEKVMDLGVIYNPQKVKVNMKYLKNIADDFLSERDEVEFLISRSTLETIEITNTPLTKLEGEYFYIGINKI